jgi:hypothetical protein
MLQYLLNIIKGKCKCKHIVITNEVRYYCSQCGKILIK